MQYEASKTYVGTNLLSDEQYFQSVSGLALLGLGPRPNLAQPTALLGLYGIQPSLSNDPLLAPEPVAVNPDGRRDLYSPVELCVNPAAYLLSG